MRQVKVKIIRNQLINGAYGHLTFESSAIARDALAGQFVQIKVDNNLEPFLRRPLGIHRVKNSQVEILYEVVGKATEILARKKAGTDLDILGPLGNGFSYSSTPGCRRSTVIVAGGIGVAPLVFLAESLARSSNLCARQPQPRPARQAGITREELLVLIGAKTKKQILCEKEFKKLGCDVKIATDNGSRGFKGRVTDLLKRSLSAIDCREATIYACGPRPMLAQISRIAQRYHIPAQVSLEEHMACGIGACLGCVVETKAGYQRVCKEGPVFDANNVIW